MSDHNKSIEDMIDTPMLMQCLEPRLMFDGAAVMSMGEALDFADGVTDNELDAMVEAFNHNEKSRQKEQLEEARKYLAETKDDKNGNQKL